MNKYLCEACVRDMNVWEMVEADSAPADDEHQHGWRQPTEEENAKAKTVTLEQHEAIHEKMAKNM